MRRLTELKHTFSTKAHQLGFTHVGITPALPVPHFDAFERWISAGHHADMHYLAREDTLAKRADPSLVLEGCQRVICLAMPYTPPQSSLTAITPGFGRVSAYARTADYHQVIQKKLVELEDLICSHADGAVKIKSYVDTGPVLERTFAIQAGLGMVGKNSNLIIPGTGSYFFLAVMLTDLALPVDSPFTHDLCGTCRRCIEACPTSCILPDRTIDARRCISYLTIENKGVIPDVLKCQIGNWLFGCDICQMVCPHNIRVQNQPNMLGEPVLPEQMNLTDILNWEEEDFKSATQNTALNRPKQRGLVRNAIVVLGNQAQATALPLLKDYLEKEVHPMILDALHWAIDQIERNQTDDARSNG
ncbi:MAG: tRNA epoxyqueuosine(34) reductase QueG [Anaerolineaceae bacterium]